MKVLFSLAYLSVGIAFGVATHNPLSHDGREVVIQQMETSSSGSYPRANAQRLLTLAVPVVLPLGAAPDPRPPASRGVSIE